MVKQNLQSWFLDTSPPSPQVAGLLNKGTFSFLSIGFLSGEQQNLSLFKKTNRLTVTSLAKMGLFGIRRELHFEVCYHCKPCTF